MGRRGHGMGCFGPPARHGICTARTLRRNCLTANCTQLHPTWHRRVRFIRRSCANSGMLCRRTSDVQELCWICTSSPLPSRLKLSFSSLRQSMLRVSGLQPAANNACSLPCHGWLQRGQTLKGGYTQPRNGKSVCGPRWMIRRFPVLPCQAV